MIEELIRYAYENPESSLPTGALLMIAAKWLYGIFTSQQKITAQLVKTDEIESKTTQILAQAIAGPLEDLASSMKKIASSEQQILLYMKRHDSRLAKIDETTNETNHIVKKASSSSVKDVGVLKLLLQLIAARQGIDITPILSKKDGKLLIKYRELLKKGK